MNPEGDRLAHWGLQQSPFDDTCNPRVYYPSADHERAVHRMVYLCRQANAPFGLLTGDVGCGKSLVARIIAQRIADPDRVVIWLPNTHFTFPHMLAEMISQVVNDGIDFDTYDEYVLTKAFARVLDQTIAGQRRRMIVVLDEAQEMSDETLRRLRLLTNLGDDVELPLTFLLVGHPVLRERLARQPALDQRIDRRYHLGPLDEPEARALLQHRLDAAGEPPRDVFDRACLDLLYDVSEGVPRKLCRYARLAMDNAFSHGLTRVDASCLEEILSDERRLDTAVRA